MKKQKMFMSLFLAAFMLLLFGSVSSADPMMAPPGGHHEDPCMAAPAGPDRAACHATMAQQHHDPNMPPPGGHQDGQDPMLNQTGGPNDHHGDQDAAHCRAMGMADGSPHVDPPQDVLDQVQAEYEANCQSGNCFLGEGNYKLLEDMGHTRAKVDCFLAEGHRQHDEQHGGPGDGNHPPAP